MYKRITLVWQQRGHSTKDPTGRYIHDMKLLWITVPEDMADTEIERAKQYAARQKNWTTYEVVVEDYLGPEPLV